MSRLKVGNQMSARRSRANSSDNPDEDNARKKERLDCAIYKLKEKKGNFAEDEDSKSNNSVSSASLKNNSKNDGEQPKKEPTSKISESDSGEFVGTFSEEEFRIIPKSDIINFNYCMWENTSNVCWLDASMALIAHNQTLRYDSSLNESSHVKKVIKYYNEAICLLNDDTTDWSIEQRLGMAKKFLVTVQDLSLEYLQPILKYNNGDPESAFCSLFNLIREDETIRKYFEVKYTKSFLCEKCSKNRITTINKPIITLPKVVAFQPSAPSFISECPSCKDQEQRIQVLYKTLPRCLIFHFENGAGKGELCPLDFVISGREYKVTGLMTLEKSEEISIDHFVSWIRDPSSDLWLECNDLNPEVLKFAAIPPHCINMEDVCMVMFEAFDDLGIIEIKTDESESIEKDNQEDEEADDDNIPFIDLSQDEPNSRSNNTRETPTRKTCGEKNMPVWSDGDDLKFLNSIRSSPSDSNTELESDKQPHSFLKQLDLKPKTDEAVKTDVSIPENQSFSGDDCIPGKGENKNSSLQDTLSPKYTDLIMKLAAQNDDEEGSKIQSPSNRNQKSKSTKQNTAEISPSEQNLSPISVDQSIKSNISQPTVVKLVASKDFQNSIENNQSSPTAFIQSESSHALKSDELNEKAIQPSTVQCSNGSSFDKVNNAALSDVPDNIHEKPPFPIEVKTTIIDTGVENDDMISTFSESMPIFPVEENTLTNILKSQKKDKSNNGVSKSAISMHPKESQSKSELKEEHKPDALPPLKFSDFLLNESSYNQMALIVKKSEEITPENIIKVIRNDKRVVSSKTSNSSINLPAKDKKRKRKLPAKDFCNLKMKPLSVNIERLTPEEILKYSPGTVFEDLTSSPASTSTKQSPSSAKFNVEYQEGFSDILKLKPSKQMPSPKILQKKDKFVGSKVSRASQNQIDEACTSGISKRRGKKLSCNSNGKKENDAGKLVKNSSLPTDSSQGAEDKSSVETTKTARPGVKRGKAKKQATNSEIMTKTNPPQGNSASSPSVQEQNSKNILSSPEKIKQEPSSVSPIKKRGRKKKTLLLPEKIPETLSNSVQDQTIENMPEAPIKDQTTSENLRNHPKIMPKPEVGKKWGRKEKLPASEDTKLSLKKTENKAIDSSSAFAQNSSLIPIQRKRGKQTKELNVTHSNNTMQDKKIPDPPGKTNPLENTDSPVRKSNRKRNNALATLKENYLLDSESKSNIPFVENNEPVNTILKLEKNTSPVKTSSPGVKNTTFENNDLDQNLDEKIPQKRKPLRRRNCITSSTSDSDVNTKSEIVIDNDTLTSLNKKIKTANSSCTSASETESINTGCVKSRNRKRIVSVIKSETTLPLTSEKPLKDEVGEIEDLKISVPHPVKHRRQKNNTIEKNACSPIKRSASHNEEREDSSPQKKIKTEIRAPMTTKSQMVKCSFPNTSKRGRKKSVDLISSIAVNPIVELSPKRGVKEAGSEFSPIRDSFKQEVPLLSGTNISIDVVARKSETSPKKKEARKRSFLQELTPTSQNRGQNRALQTPLPIAKKNNSVDIEKAIDSIVDFYISKTYSLFGIGCKEYGD